MMVTVWPPPVSPTCFSRNRVRPSSAARSRAVASSIAPYPPAPRERRRAGRNIRFMAAIKKAHAGGAGSGGGSPAGAGRRAGPAWRARS
jgi:hypothetical protein